jgi:hypothetical protein
MGPNPVTLGASGGGSIRTSRCGGECFGRVIAAPELVRELQNETGPHAAAEGDSSMSTMRAAIAAILFAVGAFLMGAPHAFAEDCDAPKPDFQIAATPASASPQAASFSGVWGGVWSFTAKGTPVQVCGRLHVSVKDSQSAAVAYCYGSIPQLKSSPKCGTFDAKIDGDVLSFVNGFGSKDSYKLAGTGTLAAKSSKQNGTTDTTEFQKIP